MMTIHLAIRAIKTGMFCDGFTDAQIDAKADWIYHKALMLSEDKANA